jgi:thiol-disulfide isomerase/thioredoxin
MPSRRLFAAQRPRMGRLAACLLSLFGLPAGAAVATAPAATASPAPPSVTAARLVYYQKGLPEARQLTAKTIPSDMQPPADKGNDVYFEARDDKGRLVGFIRDFTGPVSPAAECPCNPLSFTLIFEPSFGLRTLVSPEPLQKYGHAPMTASEQAHLVKIVKKPPPELMDVRRVEDVVDVKTGATRRELGRFVVPQAALSTRRIAGIVRDTQRILQGAPVSRDRHHLEEILAEKRDAASLATALATFLPQTESAELRQQTYRILVNAYLGAQEAGAPPDAAVEDRLLTPELPPGIAGEEITGACNRFADRNLRLPLAQRCVAFLTGPKAPRAPVDRLQLLTGTARYQSGDVAGALAPLEGAARALAVEAEPMLHLRLADALTRGGRRVEACNEAKGLYAHHPLLPGAKAALAACVPPGESLEAVARAVTDAERQTFVSKRLEGPTAPPVAVDSPDGKPVDLSLATAGKVTVAVFFATWCPHCRAELPRVRTFVESLPKDVRDKVQVVGVRTAVERESESFEDFNRALQPNFPIFTDSTMSMAFAHFAKTVGVPTALPTTAVIDEQGKVRFFIEPGDWRDTAQELSWAVNAVLSPPRAPAAMPPGPIPAKKDKPKAAPRG